MLEKSMEKHGGEKPRSGKNPCEEEGINDIATEKKNSNVIFESFDKAEKVMMKLNLNNSVI